MPSKKTPILRLGTRGSLLARQQSQMIADDLEKHHPNLKVELVIFKTTGDRITDRPLHEFGGKGLFTQELEQALLDSRVDFAVHSFKDVPVTMPLVDQSNLIIAAVPPREDPRDVLISTKAKSITDLPPGSKVGTGSLRRRCQLLALRPDLQIELIRGNIDTRIKKLHADQFDAVILALAGMRRSGLFDASFMSPIDSAQLLPCAGQGALAIQCRRDDARTIQLLSVLNDPTTATCVQAERDIVAALNGDCHSPIAALATVTQSQLHLQSAVGAFDGHPPIFRATADAPMSEPQTAVATVLKSLLSQGAQKALHPE